VDGLCLLPERFLSCRAIRADSRLLFCCAKEISFEVREGTGMIQDAIGFVGDQDHLYSSPVIIALVSRNSAAGYLGRETYSIREHIGIRADGL